MPTIPQKKLYIYVIAALVVLAAIFFIIPSFSGGKLKITYPYEGSMFPPEIAPMTLIWEDPKSGAVDWKIKIQFADGGKAVEASATTTEWTPDKDVWETIKSRSINKNAKITVYGSKKSLFGNRTVSKNAVTITTSSDSVAAPIFYRDVPLPFDFAREKMELIQWRLGDISKSERPPVVLENLPVCGNCHSFTPDGKTLAMDVDSGGDKGSYAITNLEEQTFITRDNLITWSDYKRDEKEPTFGLLAQISPNGRYAAAAVKDRVIFLGRKNIVFSQLFFPVKGIIAIYDRETKNLFSLPGANDPNFVQANPSWSPDGKYLIIARNPVTDFIKNDRTRNAVLNIPQSSIVLGGDKYLEESEGGAKYTFNLYRIPFNDGKGGTPEPVKGAVDNGMSNYFAKYSHDGKWIIFCRAKSFMLLQPDSKLYIMPSDMSAEPRLMKCNKDRLNSWHSWSPNDHWLVFSSKVNSAYTDLMLTHIDKDGNDTPPVMLQRFSSTDRARNIPEFVNIPQGKLKKINESFVDYYSYARKADKLVQFEKYEEAEASFKKSIEMNPNFPITHRNYGSLLQRLGRLDEAKKELALSIKLDPNDPATLSALATIELNNKNYAKAADYYTKAIKSDPDHAQAYEGLGICSFFREDIPKAKEYLLKATKMNAILTDSHLYLGMIYMGESDLDKAEREFKSVLKSRNDVEAMSRLGTVYIMKKDFNAAEKQFLAAFKYRSTKQRGNS